MSDRNLDQSVGPYGLGKGLAWLSRQFALAGGLIILALATMTVASIIGRSTIGMAVEGDYELVELGLAVAIFLFLPECYIRQGHVVVDLFTSGCQPSTLRKLDMLSDVLFALVSIVLVWRLWIAGFEALEYLEQTMILSIPMWWIFGVGVVSMALTGICALSNLYAFFLGRKIK